MPLPDGVLKKSLEIQAILEPLEQRIDAYAKKHGISLMERYGWAWKLDGTPLGKSPSFKELFEDKK
jgi:hypothetical protein